MSGDGGGGGGGGRLRGGGGGDKLPLFSAKVVLSLAHVITTSASLNVRKKIVTPLAMKCLERKI